MARLSTLALVVLPRASTRCFATSATRQPLVITTTTNAVSTLLMNNPTKLNGWTKPMLESLREGFSTAAADSACKVVVLTGADPYYCAGVNLAVRPAEP